MRYLIVFVVIVALLVTEPVLVSRASVQAQTNAQEKAANLRAQLLEIETRQAELQTRLQALDEQLKPENIESALAGVGSTRPEDLREQRRRQLQIERNGLQKQLELLNTSHGRLETAIAQADAEAYRQSAAPVAPGVVPGKGPAVDAGQSAVEPAVTATPTKRPRRSKKKRTNRSRRTHHSQLY
jgi:peptidoglycan hydrolase CwlO-like protein